jgi:DnaD and phage-associated domain
MKILSLQNKSKQNSTIISNQFIDTHMIKSNGEFVKIYLYLLRCSSDADISISLSLIADTFELTEKDVLRALHYWEKTGLLQLTFQESPHELTGIGFTVPLPPPEIPAPQSAAIEITATTEVATPATNIPTADRISQLQKKDEIKQLLFVAEQYLGKILSNTEMRTILYFHDTLHLSTDLIEYLIEYCVSKSSKSVRYMETVAHAWSKQKITTIEEAKKHTNLYNKNYFAILNAFGIRGRNPATSELKFMHTWLNDYCFSLELILEACSRTVNQTHQPSFPYADKILAKWKKNDVKHLTDLDILDLQHEKTKEINAKNKKNSTSVQNPIANAKNKFNNFHQRTYDYSALEKQLLDVNK